MIHDVLESVQLSRNDVTGTLEEVIRDTHIPSSMNLVHLLDLEETTLHVDVVNALLVEPNVPTRISDSVAEAMTTTLGLARHAEENQYGDERSTSKDAHSRASMQNLIDNGLDRALTPDHTLTQVRIYLLRDERIVRGVANKDKY